MTLWRKLLIAGVLVLVLAAYGTYAYVTLYYQKVELDHQAASLENSLQLVQQQLATSTAEKVRLTAELQVQQERVGTIASQVQNITTTVGTLEKLKQLDPELLKKYSKVSFLNENYIPKELTTITGEAVFDENKPQQFQARAWPFLQRLLQDAAASSVPLKIVSGYRSFGTQASLKSSYKFTYGAGTANQFSADQGYSEHQLGTTIDLTTPQLGADFGKFESTTAYQWLNANAYRYGFILSYPKKNTYYQFEPWHWRFVGSVLAQKLHETNKNFYDLDQREIDTYLVNIFD